MPALVSLRISLAALLILPRLVWTIYPSHVALCLFNYRCFGAAGGGPRTAQAVTRYPALRGRDRPFVLALEAESAHLNSAIYCLLLLLLFSFHSGLQAQVHELSNE